MTQYMINYVCAKTGPDSTKLSLIKGPKSKFPRRACLRTPLVCHMFCTQICTCLPNNPYNIILPPPPPPPPPAKTKRNPCKEEKLMQKKRSKERQPKCSHYLVKSVGRSMSTREQQLVKQRLEKPPYPCIW